MVATRPEFDPPPAASSPGPPASIPPLYCIVDHDLAGRAGWRSVDLAQAFLDGGALQLQVRAKHLGAGDLLKLCEEVVGLARGGRARVIVNDRVDVALLSHADGVHVGQQDVPVAHARTMLGPERVVGLSTHSEAQVMAALGSAISYLAVGPIYRTGTKETGYDEVGLELVRFATRAARAAADRAGRSPIPVIAIGGITLDRAQDVLAAGASSVAVISDLLALGDPAGRVRAYMARLAR